MLLTKNFKQNEFECKCGCGQCDMDADFMDMLQQLRDAMGTALYITSGYRCRAHNLNVGGSMRSFHLLGQAADISVDQSGDRVNLVGHALRLGFNGIGIGKKFIHVDNRSTQKVMWVY